jgi:hypothetical protein
MFSIDELKKKEKLNAKFKVSTPPSSSAKES